MTSPKRLIEVDLPIRQISTHARREKSIRHGHISTLHLWWARRPLAACRAVILASLWPDPADPRCPEPFRVEARRLLADFHWRRFHLERKLGSHEQLREGLLDFVADFANWDNGEDAEFTRTARALVRVAHETLGGLPGTKPLVIDPFAGGGAIPLEALRVGADTFASDLNPVAVLLNKVVLEHLPKHGRALAEHVRRWGEWVQGEAVRELAAYYPSDPDRRTPVAYLWARTVQCEGPGCGVTIPLLKSCWVSRRAGSLAAVRLVPQGKEIRFELDRPRSVKDARPGTAAKASATCPRCGYTTAKDRVRAQLRERHGGASDAVLYCVVVPAAAAAGRDYRLPTQRDREAFARAAQQIAKLGRSVPAGDLSPVPDEPIPQERVWKNNPIRVHLYGVTRWGELFAPRQQLAMATYARLVREASARASCEVDPPLAEAVGAVLALAVSRLADISNAHCQWSPNKSQAKTLFTRQAISMTWDFAEAGALAKGVAGNFSTTLATIVEVLERLERVEGDATVRRQSATHHVLADDMAAALVSDPPYYDAVPYATLADFFYVWLKRSVPDALRPLFGEGLIPKAEECVVDEAKGKDAAFFERTMTASLAEARRVVAPNGVGVVVFAHKSTAGWEAQLNAMIAAGWVVTASWPIDTERGNRTRAIDSAALASSIHLVCRPREEDLTGEWRAVLSELPKRIHEWMPRLAREGVVGADAIFACLGPALEIYSRYRRVEKASGEEVTLRAYLEQVWAAVAREALSMIFEGADASGLEEDARLTAMWLWTVASGGATGAAESDEDEGEDADDDEQKPAGSTAGIKLEFDAARKIAMGLGAHLEKLADVVEVRGDTARLLPVAERAKTLFGKREARDEEPPERSGPKAARKGRGRQLGLFPDVEPAETGGEGTASVPNGGGTTLDRVHQAMLLFGRGRSEVLKRFVVEDGAGSDARFWKLAQALSALYPTGSEEKRWVDGVLARKKGLGFG